MKKHFFKSSKGTVSIEAAFMIFFIFPILYFLITFFGFAYIYTGKAIETSRSLADYIAKFDGWYFDNTSGFQEQRLPYAVGNYELMLGLNNTVYNNGALNVKVYAAYISSGVMNICATLTNTASPSTGIFPSTLPKLDAKTLSVDGPVWIVQAAFTIRGVSYTHMAVRKPLGLYLTFSQNGTPYNCSPTMTPITYP